MAVTVDGPTTGYVRKVRINNKEYNFSVKVEYDSSLSGRNPITGQTVQLPTKGTSKVTQLYSPEPNVWVTSAVLSSDGRWVPLKKSESKDLLGNSYYPISEANDYVLGSEAISGLNSSGRNSLRYLSINDGKLLYKKSTGLSDQQVNDEFDISSNIAQPGQPGTPGLFGAAVKPDDKTQLTTIESETNETQPTATQTYEDQLELRKIKAVGLRDMDKVDIDNTRYPLDMKGMDAVLFTRKKYTPVDFNKETVTFSRNAQENATPQGRVILGIQPSVRDTNTVSWQGMTLNMFETAMADFFYSAAGGGPSGIDGFTKRAEESIKRGGADLKSGVLSLIAQEAVGTKGLTSRLTGGVFNPNLELLFQGPELRTFNFNFNLTPRKKDEADAIKRIIKFFKKGMAVQRTAAQLFLKAPHVFDIEYKLNGSQIHPSLNKIKTCALVSCSVDYTPTNSYMTFDDDRGTPVQYNLSLTFQELTPVYADEYDEDNHEIGY